MINKIENIWLNLEKEAEGYRGPDKRIYRRLDIEHENGLRISLSLPEKTREILIQIDPVHIEVPLWRGIICERISLNIPKNNTPHLSVGLANKSFDDIFSAMCEDLAQTLWYCDLAEQRQQELDIFLERWNQFFIIDNPDGLSPSRQQGIYGEVYFLSRMIQNGIDPSISVNSWKGCKGNIQDFGLSNFAIEVKTTRSKEPKKIWINNEKQLDDKGFAGLFLYVLTLQIVEDETNTLPELINRVIHLLKDVPKASRIFKRNLVATGYLDIHNEQYQTGYVVKSEDLFHISEGFPRIIEVPKGTGDLKYSVMISNCQDYKINEEHFFENIKSGMNDGR